MKLPYLHLFTFWRKSHMLSQNSVSHFAIIVKKHFLDLPQSHTHQFEVYLWVAIDYFVGKAFSILVIKYLCTCCRCSFQETCICISHTVFAPHGEGMLNAFLLKTHLCVAGFYV